MIIFSKIDVLAIKTNQMIYQGRGSCIRGSEEGSRSERAEARIQYSCETSYKIVVMPRKFQSHGNCGTVL